MAEIKWGWGWDWGRSFCNFVNLIKFNSAQRKKRRRIGCGGKNNFAGEKKRCAGGKHKDPFPVMSFRQYELSALGIIWRLIVALKYRPSHRI